MRNVPSFDLLRMVSEVEPPQAGSCPYGFGGIFASLSRGKVRL
jgi:hypothetical protein